MLRGAVGLHWLGFIALSAVVFLVFNFYYTLLKPTRLIYVLSHVLVVMVYLVFVFLFLFNDYSLYVVYSNSHEGLPWYFRVAASWSNGGGSLLFFSSIVSLLGIAVGLKFYGKTLYLGFTAVSLSGLLLAFVNEAFASNEFGVSGLGLNPLLVNFWVYPHPLTTFLSYALVVSSAILALSGFYGASRVLSGVAWVLLTLAITFGGLWSYETLGWGGYWAWDPVEVAQLIPWLLLTAAVHAIPLSLRVYEVLLLASTGSIYYGFLVVRAGLTPLHGFANPQAYTAYITITAIAILALIVLVKAGDVEVKLQTFYHYTLAASIMLLVYSALTLIGALLPALSGNILGLGPASAPAFDAGVKVYTTLLAPALIASLAITPAGLLYGLTSTRTLIAVALGGLIVAFAAALLSWLLGFKYSPLSSIYINVLGIAIASHSTYVMLVLLAGSLIWLYKKNISRSLQAFQHALLALIVLGVAVSGPYAYNQGYFETLNLKLGEEHSMLKLEETSYVILGDTVDLKFIVENDKLLTESFSKIMNHLALLAFKARADIEEARLVLYSLGILNLVEEGVSVDDVILKVEDYGLIYVRDARVKVLLTPLGGGEVALALILKGEVSSSFREPRNLEEPLTLNLEGLNITIERVVAANTSTLIAGGLINGKLRLPTIMALEALNTYTLYIENQVFREIIDGISKLNLEETPGLEKCLENAANCQSLIPDKAYKTIEMRVKLNIGEASIRYDIGGELAGVKGLVPRSIIVRSGVSDYYIGLYPKIYNLTKNLAVTEAEIAYLNYNYEGLEEWRKIALTALLVTSRLKSEIGDPRFLVDVNAPEYILATLKLYDAVINYNSSNEVVARVKVVHGVWLLWTGIFTAAFIQVILIVLRITRRR